VKDCCDDTVSIESTLPQIALVGNPNSGKTTLYNLLTGSHQKTGNWPGVTVERRVGTFKQDGSSYQLVDLPGTYSLDNPQSSEDESIARRYLISGQPQLIINVIDATQLERSLYLTCQLLEMGIPMLIVLNMNDMLDRQQITIDVQKLESEFGIPILSISARDKNERSHIVQAIIKQSTNLSKQHIQPSYPKEVYQYIENNDNESNFTAIRKLEKEQPQYADIVADARFDFAHQITLKHLTRTSEKITAKSQKFDQLVLHPWFGIPLFLFVMYMLFFLTIRIGGAFIDFFDIAAGALFVDGTRHILQAINAPSWSQVLLADGLGAGIQTVSTFIPIIAVLFFLLSALEDSGYMARAAYIMSQLMQRLGLSGRSFVPLIVGFGCNVPSIMSTRTLNNHRERITTVMMAPFMSCGARLTVYALFAAAFFPKNGQNIIFLLYFLGIIIALLTGLVLQKTILKGKAEPFLMELPRYQKPMLSSLLIHSWHRLKSFIFDAGKLIVIMVLFLNTMNVTSFSGNFGDLKGEESVLTVVAKAVTPILKPIGIEKDNWPATVGLISGLLAKEVVVGTLDALYSTPNEEDISIKEQLKNAVSSIGDNLSVAITEIGDPLGLSLLKESDSLEAAAESQDINSSTITSMQHHFNGQAGAFAYLLFILLYAPCASAVAAIARETGWKWAGFSLIWSTTLAYALSASFYQISVFSSQPKTALTSLSLSIFAIASIIFVLKIMSVRNDSQPTT